MFTYQMAERLKQERKVLEIKIQELVRNFESANKLLVKEIVVQRVEYTQISGCSEVSDLVSIRVHAQV
jgi:hypothetical protein